MSSGSSTAATTAARRAFVVTGANQTEGIGMATVLALARSQHRRFADEGAASAAAAATAAAGGGDVVVGTARTAEAAAAAEAEVKRQLTADAGAAAGAADAAKVAAGVRFLPLDVADAASRAAFVASLRSVVGFPEEEEEPRKADEASSASAADAPSLVLVANAGFMSNDPLTPALAKTTLGVNLEGTVALVDELLPDLRRSKDAGVVLVSSMLGEINDRYSAERRAELEDTAKLTREGIDAWAKDFLAAVDDGAVVERGWRDSCYAVSKMLLNCHARVWGRDETPRSGVQFFAVCPGWVHTRMGGSRAPRTPTQGAATQAWLADYVVGHGHGDAEAEPQTGLFYRDRANIPFAAPGEQRFLKKD